MDIKGSTQGVRRPFGGRSKNRCSRDARRCSEMLQRCSEMLGDASPHTPLYIKEIIKILLHLPRARERRYYFLVKTVTNDFAKKAVILHRLFEKSLLSPRGDGEEGVSEQFQEGLLRKTRAERSVAVTTHSPTISLLYRCKCSRRSR